MRTAQVFKSGNSQAVRLPKEFQFDVDEVEIFRDNDDIVLRAPQSSLRPVVDILRTLPDDFPDTIEDLPPPPRKRL